jgi:hypothetical protein
LFCHVFASWDDSNFGPFSDVHNSSTVTEKVLNVQRVVSAAMAADGAITQQGLRELLPQFS